MRYFWRLSLTVIYTFYHSFGSSIIPQTPVVCNLSEPPAVYNMNSSVDCKNLLNPKLVSQFRQNATIFKLNLSKYQTKVWSCQKMKRTDIVYKGMGPSYKVEEKTESLPITVEECRHIIETKTCLDNKTVRILYQQTADLWATNISSVIYAKMFQMKSYEVTNCILHAGTLWLNRFTNTVESSLAQTTSCDYLSGACKVNDNVILIWNPNPEAKCSYLPWKTVSGYFEKNLWFSTEGEPIVLTMSSNMTTASDNCGNKFYKSDQGVGIMVQNLRPKRNVEDSGYNPVTQAELNMKLQGIVSNLLNSPEINGLGISCALAQEIAMSWHDNMYDNPTSVIRRILRNPYIKAEIRGRALLIWTCFPVEGYVVLPMEENTCTNYIPITFNITVGQNSSNEFFGYLNPSINEILSTATEIKCDQMNPMMVELNETLFWYDYKNGLTPSDRPLSDMPMYYLPSITGPSNKTNELLSSVVYRTGISMYNRSDYVHFLDMNEMHRFSNNEKLKVKVGTPIVKNKEFSASLLDLKKNIGDILTNFSSWWSYVYWFAVSVGAIFILFLTVKIIIFCNSFISSCTPSKSTNRSNVMIIRENNNHRSKGAETFV